MQILRKNYNKGSDNRILQLNIIFEIIRSGTKKLEVTKWVGWERSKRVPFVWVKTQTGQIG